MNPQRRVHRIPITTDLSGADIALALHDVVGDHDGPTLAVLSGLHGSEWLTVEIVRRFLGLLKPSELAGRVLALPVGNPVAFNHLTRNTPLDESDASDLNRIFPGYRKTITEMLAQAITAHVLHPCQYLVDMHLGIWGATWYSVGWPKDLPERSKVRLAGKMAQAFGCPLIYHQHLSEYPGSRSAAGYAGMNLQVVPIHVEIGGAGFAPDVEERWIEMNVNGLLSVMKSIGMLRGDPIELDRYLHYKHFVRIEPSKGGFLYPAVLVDALGTEAPAGTTAGRVVSPYTLEEVENLVTPVRGVWRQIARAYPVRPGSWGFAVANLEEEGVGWGPPRDL
jgi:predicted deacylase